MKRSILPFAALLLLSSPAVASETASSRVWHLFRRLEIRNGPLDLDYVRVDRGYELESVIPGGIRVDRVLRDRRIERVRSGGRELPADLTSIPAAAVREEARAPEEVTPALLEERIRRLAREADADERVIEALGRLCELRWAGIRDRASGEVDAFSWEPPGLYAAFLVRVEEESKGILRVVVTGKGTGALPHGRKMTLEGFRFEGRYAASQDAFLETEVRGALSAQLGGREVRAELVLKRALGQGIPEDPRAVADAVMRGAAPGTGLQDLERIRGESEVTGLERSKEEKERQQQGFEALLQANPCMDRWPEGLNLFLYMRDLGAILASSPDRATGLENAAKYSRQVGLERSAAGLEAAARDARTGAR